jgi:AcrR family transcriptional regulator
MSSSPSALVARQTDLTQRLILEAALDVVAQAPADPLSVRATAKRAGMSERTVFRYFATREDLVTAAAAEFARRLDLPDPPTSLEGLLAYPEALYACFEAQGAYIRAALPSELSQRLRGKAAVGRRQAIAALLDRLAPGRPDAERRVAAANIHYHLVASTWHYYRVHFDFSPEEAVRSARTVVVQSLRGLGIDAAAPA